MSELTKYPLIVVKWEDHSSTSAWRTEQEIIESKPYLFTSIGWLVHEDKKAIKIINTIEEDGDTLGGESLILKRDIMERYELIVDCW